MDLPQSSSDITGMSPELYEAAMIGDIGIIRRYKDELNRQFTPTKNTLLHVLAQFSDSGEYVKEILHFDDNMSILLWVNTKGETALHIAARKGRVEIVNALLERSKDINKEDVESGGENDTITKQMLRMTNKVGDTALHEAIKFNHKEVAELLYKEDPEYVYPSNDMAETPLYLAAEKGNCSLVQLILTKSKSEITSYDGPRNMTTLHAAILRDCEGCTGALLKSLPFLSKKADASGWTPLHFAAEGNLVSRVRQLLNADPSLAYITASQDNNKTALHVATEMNRINAMEEILKHNPDCWEMNTIDGRNLLHIAIDSERVGAIKFILQKPWAGYLADEKDVNGDTPLHFYAISSYGASPNIVGHATDMNAHNKENLTPIDLLERSEVFSYDEDTIRNHLTERGAMRSPRNIAANDNIDYTEWKKTRQQTRRKNTFDFKKLTEIYIIVAALIATVTFAAGFTLPGGYNSNDGPHQGMAVLTRKAAFQAFMISNSIAVISSILAVFFLLLASSALGQFAILRLRKTAAILLRCSVIAMLAAFTTGSYCVLDYSPALQITVSILGGIAILVLYFFTLKRQRAFGYIF